MATAPLEDPSTIAEILYGSRQCGELCRRKGELVRGRRVGVWERCGGAVGFWMKLSREVKMEGSLWLLMGGGRRRGRKRHWWWMGASSGALRVGLRLGG